MAIPITAKCSRKYRASRSSGLRDIADIHWVVVHDEEAPTALSGARWFADPRPPDEGGPKGSAHLCVDDSICYRTLNNADIPWAAASCFGVNTHGFHVEMAGYAKWSAVLWQKHLRTLQRAAFKSAQHCELFDIPPRFVFASQLPGMDGITTHAEVTKASKRLDPQHAWKYTHTDPGPLWPRRFFMRLVRQYYAELSA